MPRSTDKLTAAGANRIFFDVMFENRSDPADDALFADALKRSGRVTLPVRRGPGPTPTECAFERARLSRRSTLFSRHTKLGIDQRPLQLPERGLALALCASRSRDKLTPSFAASLAHRRTAQRKWSSRRIIRSTRHHPDDLRRGRPAAASFPRAWSRGKDVVDRHQLRSRSATNISFPASARWAAPMSRSSAPKRSRPARPINLGWIPALPACARRCGIWRALRKNRDPAKSDLRLAALRRSCSVPVLAGSAI